MLKKHRGRTLHLMKIDPTTGHSSTDSRKVSRFQDQFTLPRRPFRQPIKGSVGIPLSFSRTDRRHEFDPATDKAFNAPSGDADQVFALQASHATDCPPGSGRIIPHRTGPSTPLGRCRSGICPSGAPRNGAPARVGQGHATLGRSFSILAPSRPRHPRTCQNRYGFRDRCRRQPASPASRQSGQIGLAFPATGSGGCPCHPRHLVAGRLTAAAQALWSGETSPEPTA